MTNEKAIMCLEDMKIKVPIPKAAKQARENNEALDVAIKALAESEHSTNLAEVGTDCINRQDAIRAIEEEWDGCCSEYPATQIIYDTTEAIERLPSAQPEIVRCKDCKHNPKYEWFGCPMSHLSETQRPETAWCWRAERRTDE